MGMYLPYSSADFSFGRRISNTFFYRFINKEIGEIRIKTSRLIGRQSLSEYIEAQWKGDETMVELEYARNKRIGLSLNYWKGGVLVNDENGVVKQKLETEPYDPVYLAYVARRASSPAVIERADTPLALVNQRVSVWFADVQRYFSGIITAKGALEEQYYIMWDSEANNPEAVPDEVKLPLKDKTLSTTNDERWCLETELAIHTRRPRKAQFGSTANDLQIPLPLNSPLALLPTQPSPKKKRAKTKKSRAKFSRHFDDESDEYYD